MFLRIGAPHLFNNLRAFLTESYSEPAIFARLGIRHPRGYWSLGKASTEFSDQDPLDVLLTLFMRGDSLPKSLLRTTIPPIILTAMQELGLVMLDPENDQNWRATMALYPAFGFFLVSDLPRELKARREDVVYPGVAPDTLSLLECLPTSKCSTFLDLGCGSGIVGITASRYAGSTWATDINSAAAICTEFGAHLNNVVNLTVACGDLYSTLKRFSFDRIVTNPPGTPSLQTLLAFSGGKLGESLTRRAIEALPSRLNQEGKFYCSAAVWDRRTERLEDRIRQWLGRETESEFDIFVAEYACCELGEVAFRLSEGDNATRTRWQQLFMDEEVLCQVHGLIVIQRKTSTGARRTTRRKSAPSRVVMDLDEWDHPSNLDEYQSGC